MDMRTATRESHTYVRTALGSGKLTGDGDGNLQPNEPHALLELLRSDNVAVNDILVAGRHG